MATLSFEEFVEQVREKNLIEDVIAHDGYRLHGGGRYRKGADGAYNSLVVDTLHQKYTWNSKDEIKGDVFEWICKRQNVDFMTALQILAQKVGMEMPKRYSGDAEGLKRKRATEDTLKIAAFYFHDLLWKDDAALAYARRRGFSDETIRASVLGFSGGSATAAAGLRGEYKMNSIDTESPAAVAMLGYAGDVAGWGAMSQCSSSPDWDRNWEEKGRIHGMVQVPGLVYPHFRMGVCEYMTRRNLPGHDRIGEREWKSHNPQKALLGERLPYLNHIWRPAAPECAIVEGQADAITFGQWALPSLALCGIGLGDDAKALLKKLLGKHRVLYVAMDNDAAGKNVRISIAQIFGAMTRMVNYASLERAA